MTVPLPIRALLIAALLLFVGAVLLRGVSADGQADPIASLRNGGPRGLLLLDVMLQRQGTPAVIVESDATFAQETAHEAQSLVVIVPPPEQSAFTDKEAAGLIALVDKGAVVVIGCDPDEDRQKRLRALLRHTGVRCDRAPEGTAAQEFPLAAPRGHSLFVRDRGRVLFGEETPGVVPLVDGVVAAVSSGAGAFVVLGSTSVLSNDGLTEADNALFIASLMRRHIVVDERHHLTRGAAAVQKAAQKGPGPVTALVCLLLLIPLTLLGFSPRRGELMTSDDDLAIPAGEARVRGLAALLHGDMK